jgi:GNAT superfamily N-acetyltransferase
MEVRLRPARPDEGGRLREIAIASKLHWGYGETDVLQWVANGDFSADGLRAKEFYVADAGGVAVAFASLVAGEVAVLDDLWVEPGWIGKGVGATLFRAVAERAAELGARSLEWDAEPHAVGFYERMGARHLRDSGPSSWGRTVPVMGIEL